MNQAMLKYQALKNVDMATYLNISIQNMIIGTLNQEFTLQSIKSNENIKGLKKCLI